MNNNLKEQLFPNGVPSPEEFIRVVAAYVREQMGIAEMVGKTELPAKKRRESR